MNSYYKIALASILIGGAVAGTYLYIQQDQQKDAAAAVQMMIDDVFEARNADAIQKAQVALADKQPSDPIYSKSLSIIVIASMNDLRNQEDKASPEEWITIIDLAKKQFESTNDPYTQAIAINTMSTILHASFYDPAVAEEIFKDAPFKALRGEDLRSSLYELASYSIEAYPTASAYTMRARVRADAINSLLRPGSVVPINAADKPDLIAKVTHIEENLKEAKKLQGRTTSPAAILTDNWNAVWGGYALSQAARVDEKYWPDAEGMFKDAIQYTETTVDENGDPYPALLQLAATARLRYARALYDIFGDARAADITTQLDTLSAMIGRQPELYAAQGRFFTAINKSQSSGPAAGKYQEYASLAKYSPAFTSYLKSRGWEL